MRLNYIGGASTTGGTGALTVSSAGGLVLPATAFVADQTVEYSIVEYTDSTLATVSRAESGWGVVSSSNVLTRSAPRTTWTGSTYTQASASALSFGASNVRVYVAPIAEGGATAFPVRLDFSANYGPNGYVIGANCMTPIDLPKVTLSANYQYMVPLLLQTGFALSQIGVEVTTLASSATINAAIASMDPTTGAPGRILAAANGLSGSSTGVKMGSISSRLLAPGWYWQLINSGHEPELRGSEAFLPGPFGLEGARIQRGVGRVRTQADYTVGADAMSGVTGSYNITANNTAYPILLMR